MKKLLVSFLKPFLGVLLGLSLSLVVAFCLGENPWKVLKIIAESAFGSRYHLGTTLFYTTPLIFTGLSVATAFQCGLFNIGAEGQLLMGAFAATWVGFLFPDCPSPWAPLLGVTAAFLGGGIWGLIPGWLKAYRKSHEVINTIMLNFIAVGITSYLTLSVFPNLETQNPETREIGPAFKISHLDFFADTSLSVAFFLALFVAFLVWFILWRTVFGYELRATGQNELAATLAGVDVRKIQMRAFFLAGGLAGLVGVAEVLGNSGKFRMGFSPEYGFIGIAVALLGRNKPLGVVLAAFLFGALHKGAMDLDLETEVVTRDLSLVLQALIILSVTAEGLWSWIERMKRRET